MFQFFGLYVESLATTSAMFTITARLSRRARPYVYNTTNNSLDKKNDITATRSFYLGHEVPTATASFFDAKVYQDFHPDSPAIPYV